MNDRADDDVDAESGARRFRLREIPLSAVNAEAWQAAMLEAAAEEAAAFPRLVDELSAILLRCYPPHLVAVLAGWGLLSGLGPDGVTATGMIAGIEQHHVELLQALILTLPADRWGEVPAAPTDIQATIDTLKALASSFSRRRLLELREAPDAAAKTALALRARVRDHTQYVRNWGYGPAVAGLIKALHAPLDAAFAAHHGFSVSDLVDVAVGLTNLLGRRLNERFQLLREISQAGDIRALVERYFERYPGVEGDWQAFLAAIPADATLEQVRFRLLSHADIWLLTYMTFSVETVTAHTRLPATVVERVLASVSAPAGALAGHDVEHLFLDNPAWCRPGLRSGADVFMPAPQSLISHINRVIQPLGAAAGLKAAIEKRRAAYLETEVERLLAAALTGAAVKPGLRWAWAGEPYETDVLVLIDRVAIIAEAKSAALTPEGLRGAPDRLRRHVRDLIVKPAQQSARLADLIRRARDGDGAARAVLNGMGVDAAGLDTVVRLSVTLDDLSMLTSAEGELKQAGWVPGDLDLGLTISLADLQAVIEILERPALVVHYLMARARLQKAAPIFGDELDFLGTYLASGFHMPEVEAGTHKVSLSGMSAEVDNFMVSREARVAIAKPAPPLTPYFTALLDLLASRRRSGWLAISLMLLDAVSPDGQVELDAALEALKASVAQNGDDPDHLNSIIVQPAGPRRTAAVFHVFRRTDRPLVVDRLETVAAEAFAVRGIEQCVMVARMIEAWDTPFAIIGTTRRAAPSPFSQRRPKMPK